ncbi:helix-turn-helix transcriptional regulator [Paracoccus fistulariae]|uniref:Autoinducer binding domain-containing protein n=1 Tax=Paracoccus fistulariae TaxID=658446 RepID=A0ABY7SHH5_9RHOB|nr:helix-turn-helix transcriptional regulator [Paracoccus fistulariae]MDB6181061.1 helix-turn-helix transcriptional regulator [Paracoccus fistulariae]WCR06355.1 autoinducer binding domain-containing protein [Paracoccus fistulariae]
MTLEPTPSAADYLRFVAECSALEPCWQQLCTDLASFGFTRMLYGRKADASAENFFELWDTLILSTLGPEIEAFFVNDRGYATTKTVSWVVDNAGPLSWGHAQEMHRLGRLTPAESRMHLAARAFGLHAGYNFGMPIRPCGLRSGFAIWCHGAQEQTVADEAWATAHDQIIPRLYAFDIAASRYRYTPKGQELTQRERDVLQFAAKGKTILEIAQVLELHRRTVEDAMSRARDKLEVATTLQAVLRAEQQGQL